MERIQENRPAGIGRSGLRAWGMIFLAAGIIGRSVIQTHILGLGSQTMAQLFEILNSSDTAMGLVTLSLVLQAVETCAAPIFAFLLVEGVQRTSDRTRYFLRVLGLALVTEIPYNLAMGGKVLDMSSRNPVFGLVLSMIMLLFYQRYSDRGVKNTAIKLVVTLAAIVWGQMLKVDSGAPLALIVSVLWLMRKKPSYRSFVGMAAAVMCTGFTPFYLASPMGFLVVFLYNGEEGESSRVVNYLAYPVMLAVAAAAGFFLK